MTHEAIIEKVKKKYAGADEATIHAVLQTLQDAEVDWRWSDLPSAPDVAKALAMTFKQPLQFFGENPSPEAYRKLSFDERGALSEQLKEKNHQWLAEKFDTLKAAWLMVIDGEIIASGENLKTYPQREQISEILSRYGKQPFIFINDFLLAIEESWHSTVYKNDFYPTVSIVLQTDSGSLEIDADFDTGATSSFADYDLLKSHHVVEPYENEYVEISRHLSETFGCVSRLINVEVKLLSGEVLRRTLPIQCVEKWNKSPFVRINPRRTALAGRDIFLELQPSVTLDFANRHTTISAPITS
jgi:hypothetical protein